MNGEFKYVWIKMGTDMGDIKYYPVPSSETKNIGLLVENIKDVADLDGFYECDISPNDEKEQRGKMVIIRDDNLRDTLKKIIQYREIILACRDVPPMSLDVPPMSLDVPNTNFFILIFYIFLLIESIILFTSSVKNVFIKL